MQTYRKEKMSAKLKKEFQKNTPCPFFVCSMSTILHQKTNRYDNQITFYFTHTVSRFTDCIIGHRREKRKDSVPVCKNTRVSVHYTPKKNMHAMAQ